MPSSRRAIALAFAAGVIAATAAFSAVQATQPHLTAALKSLEDAAHHLSESKPGTGMHTQATVAAAKSAIAHAKEAIAANEEK